MMRFNCLNYLTKEVGFGKWRHSKKQKRGLDINLHDILLVLGL